MKIGFLISTLGPGGAERVAATLCNGWTKVGHEVTILTLQSPAKSIHYDIESKIKIRSLDLSSVSTSVLWAVWKNFLRIRRIRKEVLSISPDVLICFMTETNVLGILACLGTSIPVVVSERVHPGHHKLPRMHQLARSITYRWADLLIVQTDEIAMWCARKLKLRKSPIVIANPVDRSLFSPEPCTRIGNNGHSERKRIVSVGRLEPQKGMSDLIAAFATIKDRHGDWVLEIYGEGSLRMSLQEEIDRRGLSEQVYLKGVTKDIRVVLRSAEIFALASRYEGSPNALIEALSCGACCIASDASGAAARLLGDDKHGVLVRSRDPEDWASKLSELMASESKRKSVASHAIEAVADLDVAVIAQHWLDSIDRSGKGVSRGSFEARP